MAGRIVSLQGAASRLDVQTGAGSRAGLCASTSRLALIALLGAGGVMLTLPTSAKDFPVNNASDLADALNRAANDDTITFKSDITLSSNLPSITKNVTIFGDGKTLSGQDSFRGFVVGDPFNTSVKPTVAINNLSIIHTLATGGRGAPGDRTGGAGGGGAGLGGGLLILAGANVTASNVFFQ